MKIQHLLFASLIMALISCGDQQPTESQANTQPESNTQDSGINPDDIYTSVQLTTDVSLLSDEDKQIIPLLIEAGKIMDDLFWQEAYGNKDSLLNSINDPNLRRYAEINYGPWDRLDDNKPFIEGVGEKPAGAQFYPLDMTKEEFESWNNAHKTSLYTMVVREGNYLKHKYYHQYFADEIQRAAELLKQAAAITTNRSLQYYLELRADALLRDSYNASDIAWLALEDNTIDVIIGPIENYEDHLFGYKAAHECYVLVKDLEWSKRLERYKDLLPQLQDNLPVGAQYKRDPIGGNAQLNAYDVIFYAGDCNAGSKTIAVNLPNDETIQQEHGTRRSQLKNAMKAKYDKILVPISDVLIAEDQRKHITFDAFFGNTMFHEVAHGLGIKNTITNRGTVREALKEQASALEEGKADILGLWMVTQLYDMGEMPEGELMDNYVTFLAGIFRSVRFGAASAHGKANMLRFNYFQEQGAFSYDAQSGTYSVNPDKMGEAVTSLSHKIIELQGRGDYDAVKQLMEEKAVIGEQLQRDLDTLSEKGIPVDVVFEQGVEVLGL
ncbi:MAG: Zn-dependent hydrolase [Flavobacteriales bacterium]|nr:Zn-dependent hydrolase [Flavobacteriales bacterium]